MNIINHAILHKLIKEKHGKATITERADDLPITETVAKLVWDIHNL